MSHHCLTSRPRSTMQRSLSLNDTSALEEDFEGLIILNDKAEIIRKYNRYNDSPQILSKTKFISMAEAIYHFERDTPERFHSKGPNYQPKTCSKRLQLTVPCSPILRSVTRSRRFVSPTENKLGELNKNAISSTPKPKLALPFLPIKPITIPEPFKLTEVKKKVLSQPIKISSFKARPIPKHILGKPHIPVKPISPRLYMKKDQPVCHNTMKPGQCSSLKRDKVSLKQCEEKSNK